MAKDARVHKLVMPVAELLGRPGEYRDVSISEPLDGVRGPLARVADDPVTASLRAESVVEGVLVTGPVAAHTILQCARCLREFESDLGLEVCELFVAPSHLSEAEDDSYRVTGTEIHLEPMLRDAVTLALPLHPLCRQDCRGICARCGTDLNTGECSCSEDGVDPRWAELDAVRARLEGTQGGSARSA
jgi:uncharacterized protein